MGGRGSTSSGGAGALSANAENAVEGYVSGDEMWINNYLRGETSFSELNSSEKQVLAGLDEATNTPLGESQTLYRSVDASSIFKGISDSDYESLQSTLLYGDKQKYNVARADKVLNSVKAGDVLTEKGFMSTTQSRRVAEDFGDFTGSSKPIIVRLQTPANAKGFNVGKSKYEVKGDEQKEVLLKRNTRYKIGKVYANNGNIYVDATVVP